VYWCYQVIVGLMFWLLFPLLLLAVLLTGKHRRGLAERLGCYRRADQGQNRSIIWLHAASIGEITVARTLIEQVQQLVPDASFVVTTMTIHGRDYARSLLPESQPVYLAPLDVPGVTDRVVRLIRPAVYVCLETELWPLLLGKIKRSGATVMLLNGRLSERSIGSYRRFRSFFGMVLDNYDRIAVIGEKDRLRFLSLGVRPEVVTVTGNVKEDCAMIHDPEAIRDRWRRRLHVSRDDQVFVAASTHDPEEVMLLPLIVRLLETGRLCLLAPRHPQRLPQLETLCGAYRLSFDLLSDLKRGQARRHPLILVDTLGDLAEVYSVAGSAFIGGSLVDYGGHNLMEAARWNCVVFFGPSTDDFQEAAATLEHSGGGIRIDSPKDLEGRLLRLLGDHRELARRAAEAGRVARRQSGAANRQAALVAAAFGRQHQL
jgi:3-deoxy-D-manno-octulosonic-acid transferase